MTEVPEHMLKKAQEAREGVANTSPHMHQHAAEEIRRRIEERNQVLNSSIKPAAPQFNRRLTIRYHDLAMGDGIRTVNAEYYKENNTDRDPFEINDGIFYIVSNVMTLIVPMKNVIDINIDNLDVINAK